MVDMSWGVVSPGGLAVVVEGAVGYRLAHSLTSSSP